MWSLVMYSNYFKIVSTVTFLDLRTRIIRGMFLFNTVYTRYNMYVQCLVFRYYKYQLVFV